MIVNADDFGLDESTSRAILEAFEKGYITHTTLMANMPYAGEAAELIKKAGLADKTGLHLNITSGMPLSQGIKDNPLICADNGQFNAAFYHAARYRLYMDDLSISQIRDEFKAQIEKFLSFGLTELHIDSHHHVHTNYPVYRALCKLNDEYGFKYVRLSRNMYHGGNPANRIYKTIYNTAVKRVGTDHTDLFGSYRDLRDYVNNDPERLKKLLSSKDIEVMVHPMYDGNGVLCDTDIKMEDEWELLCLAQR